MPTPAPEPALALVHQLGLQPHPEGGYYKEVYRSPQALAADALPAHYGGFERPAATGIYFLLFQGIFSAFHRLAPDEGWHHYLGSPVHIYSLQEEGDLTEHLLGKDLQAGQRPQLYIPGNTWFASEVTEPGGWALVGCTVAPGFDFRDFELARAEALVAQWPTHEADIRRLCRQ